MWRTVGDFWDNWKQLKQHFKVFERWNKWRSFGAYPDGDMLPLGHIGIRAERGDPRMSAFTKDEQYTLMTLMAIFRSPLMFGGNLPDNDAFTLSLLTNKNVLHVLNSSTNNKQLFNKMGTVAWIANDSKTNDKYLAVFNIEDQPEAASMVIPVSLKELGISNAQITDLWTGENKGNFSDIFSPVIKPHACGFYKLQKIGRVIK